MTHWRGVFHSYLPHLEAANGLRTDTTGASLGIKRSDEIAVALTEPTGRPHHESDPR